MSKLGPDDYRARAEKRIFFRKDITLERIIGVANTGCLNANQASFALDCGRNVIVRVLKDHGFRDWDSFVAVHVGSNHKVRAVIPVKLDTPVPVYDLEVDEWHNFALAAGVFVHNSKDVADALCGMVTMLHKMYKNRLPNLPEKGISIAQESQRSRHIVAVDPFVAAEKREAGLVAMQREHLDQAAQTAKKVWPKRAPETVAPTYRKRMVDGTVKDLTDGGATATFDPEEFMVRG